MSFPDVPFDEKLFESNELLRSYWDRATDSRPIEIPEGYLEAEDLRDMTEEAFLNDTNEIAEEIGEVVESTIEGEKSDLVYEKAAEEAMPFEMEVKSLYKANGSLGAESANSKWVIICFLAIFVIAYLYYRNARY